jgi:hypothetical protein
MSTPCTIPDENTVDVGSNSKQQRLLDNTSSWGIIFTSMTTPDDGLAKTSYDRFELWQTVVKAPGRSVAIRTWSFRRL